MLSEFSRLFILGQVCLEEFLEFGTELNFHLHKVLFGEQKHFGELSQTGLHREATADVVQQLNWLFASE